MTLALTNKQLEIVQASAATLPPYRRQAFLAAIADELRGRPFDDAAVFRAARHQLRRFIEEVSAGYG